MGKAGTAESRKQEKRNSKFRKRGIANAAAADNQTSESPLHATSRTVVIEIQDVRRLTEFDIWGCGVWNLQKVVYSSL
jgi:hypothetical protein